ncbi:MAG: DUF2877 domain-containing protein [Candidatus Aminicenantes bacterium]|nr:DUF2877 domain-containing protein [Candidatus Aminicenantes bacterium]
MIRLESYGDSLEKGVYRCHSRFRRAVNFSNGRSLATLVDRRVGPGPRHIVVCGLALQKVERLAIGDDDIFLDGLRIPFASARRYDSRLRLEGPVVVQRFAGNLECFSRCLGREAPPRSLAFLLDDKRSRRRPSALEQSVAERLRLGRKMIFSPDFLPGIKMVAGLGFGLTPGGDDFIGGLLLALYYGQQLFKRNFESAIRLVCRSAEGKNPFSGTMLADAGEGRAVGRVKSLLAALINGNEKKVRQNALQLRAIGHSSGIDLGVGLLLTGRALVRNQGEPWW